MYFYNRALNVRHSDTTNNIAYLERTVDDRSPNVLGISSIDITNETLSMLHT